MTEEYRGRKQIQTNREKITQKQGYKEDRDKEDILKTREKKTMTKRKNEDCKRDWRDKKAKTIDRQRQRDKEEITQKERYNGERFREKEDREKEREKIISQEKE